MIVVDTTVLVYATGRDHPLQQPAIAALQAFRDGEEVGTTTPEVIQEFAHVRARRLGRLGVADVATAYARLLRPLEVVTEEHLGIGLALWDDLDTLGTFDAVLAGVAITHGAELLSADRAFAQVPGLRFRPLHEWPR